MDISKYKNDNLIIVCPTEEKNKILEELSSDNNFYNIKFMTKEEFKSNYYFSYDEEALSYLMEEYNYSLDVAKVYLNNLYIIEDDKEYKDVKLVFLSNLKKELSSKKLLHTNPIFKNYLEKREVITVSYYDLDKYEEKMLGIKDNHENEQVILNVKVVENATIEEEVNNICLKIIELLNTGIDINKIYLTNITSEYLYTLKKIFSYYNIPINIDMKNSIYPTKVVQDFLINETIDQTDPKKQSINNKITSIISSLAMLDKDTKSYHDILIDKLKNTYINPPKYSNAINIKNLFNEEFHSDEYVFILGLNRDILPKVYQDTEYITDNIKDEVAMYKTPYLNKRSKLLTAKVISSIKNVFISYKLSSSFSSFYKSNLITDYNLEVVKPDPINYNYSNIYNKITLGKKLDLYNLYGIKDDTLKLLYSNTSINYKTYSNEFTGIDNDLYLKNLPFPLKLSYTSLNSYSECQFKYYIKYVLKLDPFTDNFSAYIGSLYHQILSLYNRTNFDFEKEWSNYLETRELSVKERLLLVKIKKDLKNLIEELKKKELLTGYNDNYYEKKIDIDISSDISVIFTGTIDRIMYYSEVSDTYFSIIDYKTGTIDTSLEKIKYGLSMQLPIYLYLINYSKVFTSPIFTGLYYQNILFNYPTWDKDLNKIKNDRLLLKGYSTDKNNILERFDSTIEKSSLIKGMSYDEEKGFSRNSKLINDDTLYELLNYTKNYINKTKDNILNANFSIDPKVYSGNNISCNFCKYKDLCYMMEKDLIYLDKVEDLSFLGGDNNA